MGIRALLIVCLQALPGRPIPEYDALFDRAEGWTGADAAYSVPLGADTTLWLYGDTWVDRYGGKPKLVNNSIAIQKGMSVEFSFGKGRSSFFQPPDGKGWLWPGAGVRTRDALHLFLHRVDRAGNPGPWDFKMTGTLLAAVRNPSDPPDRWEIRYSPLPWFGLSEGGSRFFGAAVLPTREFIYVYGQESTRKDALGGAGLLAARVAPDQVADFERWEFLGEKGWGPKPDSPKKLCRGVATEFSVSALPSGKYVLVTSQILLSPVIVARYADDPAGPWSKEVELYRCPEPGWDKSYFCYAAKAHPELAKGDELIVTYACNGGSLGDVVRERRIYRPRFVRVAPADPRTN